MSTIYLCGFMGCGKSTVGKELAKLLNSNFIDLDLYIENGEKMSIPEIFSKHGESYFRELETKAISKLSNKSAVIATGGGALIPEKNIKLAKQNGIIAFIDTDFEICYKRISKDNNRPIVKKSTKKKLLELFEKRYTIYKLNCDILVNGDNTPQNIASLIYNSLQDKK